MQIFNKTETFIGGMSLENLSKLLDGNAMSREDLIKLRGDVENELKFLKVRSKCLQAKGDFCSVSAIQSSITINKVSTLLGTIETLINQNVAYNPNNM